jgi:hypothetical protein
MFKARTNEDVLKDLQPKELKQNEIYNLAEQYFEQYSYKKIGLLLDQKVVKLNFDFPKIINNSVYETIKEYENYTGWTVEINKQANYNEAEIMIRALLNEYVINKISLYAVEGKYNVQLENSSKDFSEVKEKFYVSTGLILEISYRDSDFKICEQSILEKESIIEADYLEQNQTLSYIDEQFKGEAFKPYKKSIKGTRNIELSFISPNIGERYKEKLKKIEIHTGWSIIISSKINQNEIINLAIRLCRQEEIEIKKNPSFNPFDTTVMINLKNNFDSEKMKKIKDEFEYCTECTLLWN